MKKIAILAIIAVVLTFSSCDDFFKTTWGNQRSYDPSNIDVTPGNIDEWAAAVLGNPDLAGAVSEAIIEKLKNTSDPAEKAALLDGGVKIAVESSGLGESLLTRGAELLGDAEDINEDTILELLEKIQSDFNSGNGVQAADYIAEMLVGCISIGPPAGVPHFDPEYANIVKPGDVAEAILVLILGELGRDDELTMDDWDDIKNLCAGLDIDFDTGDYPHVVVTDETVVSDTALALAAYLNLIIDNPDKFADNPLTDAIRNAFFGDE